MEDKTHFSAVVQEDGVASAGVVQSASLSAHWDPGGPGIGGGPGNDCCGIWGGVFGLLTTTSTEKASLEWILVPVDHLVPSELHGP